MRTTDGQGSLAMRGCDMGAEVRVPTVHGSAPLPMLSLIIIHAHLVVNREASYERV